LASRKSPERAVFQIVESHLLQSFSRSLQVFPGMAPPGFASQPAREYYIQHGYGKGSIEKGMLRCVSYAITIFLRRGSEKEHPSFPRSKQSQGQLEKSRLSSSIGADDTGELSGADGEVYLFQDLSGFVAE